MSHLPKPEERKSKPMLTGKSLTKDVALVGRLACVFTGLAITIGLAAAIAAEPPPPQTGKPLEEIGTVRQVYDGALYPDIQVQTFRNIDRLFPTRTVKRGTHVYPLPQSGTPLKSVEFVSAGKKYDIYDYMSLNRVSGLLVIKDGKIALERYKSGNKETTRWMSMSMVKSISRPGRPRFRLQVRGHAHLSRPGRIGSALGERPELQTSNARAQAQRITVGPHARASRGRVTIDKWGNPVIHYALSKTDAQHLLRGVKEGARLLTAAGAREVYTLHTRVTSITRKEKNNPMAWERFDARVDRLGAGPNNIMLFSAHQLGTCRMGAGPTTSVTDERGRVHGYHGLYVADGSIFPQASGINPMITIMGLAHWIGSGMVEDGRWTMA